MTNDELEAVRARAESATAGPWVGTGSTITDWRDFSFTMEWMVNGAYPNEPADRAFIAHARTDIPALLALLDRYRYSLAVEQDRATRAEAHAERLAASLKLASDWLERRTWGHPADCDALDGSDDIIDDARQALSAYRGEMK